MHYPSVANKPLLLPRDFAYLTELPLNSLCASNSVA